MNSHSTCRLLDHPSPPPPTTASPVPQFYVPSIHLTFPVPSRPFGTLLSTMGPPDSPVPSLGPRLFSALMTSDQPKSKVKRPSGCLWSFSSGPLHHPASRLLCYVCLPENIPRNNKQKPKNVIFQSKRIRNNHRIPAFTGHHSQYHVHFVTSFGISDSLPQPPRVAPKLRSGQRRERFLVRLLDA